MKKIVFWGWLAALLAAQPEALPTAPYLDLGATLPLAEVRREPGRLDLESREAAFLLRRGFAHPEEASREPFVWSEGPESELVFFLTEPRPIELSWRCRPFSYPGAPPQSITFIANGQTVGQVTLDQGRAPYRLTLPEGALRSGDNQLLLRYAWTRSPAETSGGKSADRRQLAVAWREIAFAGGSDPAARVRAAGGQLALPRGAQIDYFVVLAPRSTLTLAGLSAPRGGAPRLEVIVRGADAEPRSLARLEPSGKPVRLALPETGRRPIRLSLRALHADLVLKKPAVDGYLPPPPAASPPPPARPAPARNVLVYLIDTLRADHLGCYGYHRPTSPHIDRFAAEATLFANAVAQSPWTRPSTASLFTGVWPRTHAANGRHDALPPEALTLAEILAARGYRTAGFVSNGNIARSLGFGQGFEKYRLLPSRGNRAPHVNAEAFSWLDSLEGNSPFFLYLHTVEPHAIYDPPSPFRERFAPGVEAWVGTRQVLKQLKKGEREATPALLKDLRALYDGEIAANDAAFGELVAGLQARGLWDDTVVVVLSDHGEEFHEHGGWEHGDKLFREVLEIPLILRLPGLGAGRTVARQAQQIDVVPTLLTYLDIEVPAPVEGRNLLPLIAGEAAPELGDDVACSWMEVDDFVGGAVSAPDWRLQELSSPQVSRRLFSWSDLAEKTDLVRERPVAAGVLRAALAVCGQPKRGRLKETKGTIDDEVREQLRALGYID